jgi:uncharacterized membrane protein
MMKKRNAKLAELANRISLALAVLVVTGSTLYVVAEQPWFPSSPAVAAQDFPFIGIIRDKLSHHR